MGIGYRVKMLLQTAKDEQAKKELLQAVERLVSPNQMGAAYKFCALTQKSHIPYGFE
jgi:SAM-dependent MidA family methyltransferase